MIKYYVLVRRDFVSKKLVFLKRSKKDYMNNKSKLLGKLNMYGLYIVMVAGILIRFIYVLTSTIYDRQYDIGMIDLDAGHTVSGGHLAYIQYLYENMKLADVDPSTVYQFHHPPMHHFISAVFMRFVSIFTNNTDVIEESMQWVPFACSVVILFAAVAIMKRFKIEGPALCFGLGVLAFHPSLILLSGSVNNDGMALMFSVLSVLMTMIWIEKRDMKSIAILAVCLGLGISTKQNVAELAFAVGIVFLIILVKEIKLAKASGPVKDVKSESGLPKLIMQYVVAGVISLPLGMWFYIRNLVKYNMSLLWVYELPTDSWQYTGNVSVINRFLWPVPSEMIDNLIHFKIGCGYNVWMQIMRTSVLGEWDMAQVGKPIKLIAVLLMLTGIFIAFVAFICMIKAYALKDKSGSQSIINPLYRVLFGFGYISVMVSYLVFAYKYPQQCSMHFRYIEITLLFGAVALGVCYGKINSKVMRVLWNLCLCVFAVLSLLMCAVWCFM